MRRCQEAGEGAELHLGPPHHPPALLPITSIFPLRLLLLNALLLARLATFGRLEHSYSSIKFVLV